MEQERVKRPRRTIRWSNVPPRVLALSVARLLREQGKRQADCDRIRQQASTEGKVAG